MAEPQLAAEPIIRSLHAAYNKDTPRAELLALAASRIHAAGEPYTSVYLYMLDDSGETLVLEAHAGRDTPHTRIPVGKGLCGRAVRERTDLNVPDVAGEAEYLACNLDTKSELIALIRRHDEILGQIDIDSDTPNGFDDAEHAALRRVADALAALL